MLSHLTHDAIHRIITAADQLQQADNDHEPDLTDLSALTVADFFKHTDEYRRLHQQIDALTPEARAELCALMWIGRGDGCATASEWTETVQDAQGMDIEYIAGNGCLAEYVREGVRILAAVG